MRILLITTSARGHAIADVCSRSSLKPEIVAIFPSKNPGIAKCASLFFQADLTDFDRLLEIARETKPDFAIIGPEDPICAGLVDLLEEHGIPSIAPKKTLARIESSKGFTRTLLEQAGIDASPKFQVFGSGEQKKLNTFIEQELKGDFVVKHDGLKGGKGVKVSGDHLHSTHDGVEYALQCIEEAGQVVIEEKLIGCEFSLLSFVSGKAVVDMPIVQDHKRAFEGDSGPNTGGMGTVSDADHSLPFLSTSDLRSAKEINRLVAEALLKECGEPYKGILYGGFMAVKDGVRLIEYNCRFGDPEALNILSLLESDFVETCQAIISGELNEEMVSFAKKATVCTYIVPEGYPENKDQRGEAVSFPSDMPENARLFFGDISEDAAGVLRIGGSRTAGVVGIGETMADAFNIAQSVCSQVEGPVRFRSDIGTEKLMQSRVSLMEKLRGMHV